ncbi:hypothetical protein CVS40_6562 [Lucilia cuprina]|nr:hypothetical protein CVS40_6562 [Lucilia cuprina]
MLMIFSSQCGVDVFVIAETWLNSDFQDGEFFDMNLYNIYRRDGRAEKTGCLLGGGILIAVKKD